MSTVLSVEGLTVALPPGADRPHALEDVSLKLGANEVLCVVGESGSGKSMTASAVLGLLPEGVRAAAGRILFDGRNLLTLSDAELRG
jgi:peptide/nickel transport system ATP-binding protein